MVVPTYSDGVEEELLAGKLGVIILRTVLQDSAPQLGNVVGIQDGPKLEVGLSHRSLDPSGVPAASFSPRLRLCPSLMRLTGYSINEPVRLSH